MERMIRRWKSLTEQEVQTLIDSSTPEKYAHGGLGGGPWMLPFAENLPGKTLTFRFREHHFSYHFTDLHTLDWKEGETAKTEYYDAHELRPGIFFLQHMIKGSRPARCRTLVFDLNTGLVTLIAARFGNGIEAREVARDFHFGRIDGYDAAVPLHHFTDELVGKAIAWQYHPGGLAVKHIYSSEYFYSYSMQVGDKCWMASNPCDFVRIADQLYIFSFLEERQTGCQGVFLMDFAAMHDVGSFLSINGDGNFECYTVGAKGEWGTMHTYFGR